ncbi:MAG: hypothetical protein ACXVDD_00510, partial [Polyangia bacterium]
HRPLDRLVDREEVRLDRRARAGRDVLLVEREQRAIGAVDAEQTRALARVVGGDRQLAAALLVTALL